MNNIICLKVENGIAYFEDDFVHFDGSRKFQLDKKSLIKRIKNISAKGESVDVECKALEEIDKQIRDILYSLNKEVESL